MAALFNKYYALRHGISLANEKGIIISSPENGINDYGLSHAGFEDAGNKFDPAHSYFSSFRRQNTICLTSEFLRARQTAEIFCERLGLPAAREDHRLRERFFGRLEGSESKNYHTIWKLDEQNLQQDELGFEHAKDVLSRMLDLVHEHERIHWGKHVVLVSHGDPLQILQTWFNGLPPNMHRQIPQLENAELRQLQYKRA